MWQGSHWGTRQSPRASAASKYSSPCPEKVGDHPLFLVCLRLYMRQEPAVNVRSRWGVEPDWSPLISKIYTFRLLGWCICILIKMYAYYVMLIVNIHNILEVQVVRGNDGLTEGYSVIVTVSIHLYYNKIKWIWRADIFILIIRKIFCIVTIGR